MNRYERDLLDHESVKSPLCVVCGRPATDSHHVVMKGAGGVTAALERRIPTLTLCGMGNASGCHGMAHRHMLHFRWRDGWEWLATDEPVKYGKAIEMGGWRPIRRDGQPVTYGRKTR